MGTALLSVYLTGSAWWDLRTGRIPNLWTALGAAGFLTLQYMIQYIRGPSGSLCGFLSAAAVFLLRTGLFTAVFFLLFLFRMMGAGDIKAMALIGGYLGIFNGFSVIFYGLSAAAAWSFFHMIHRGILMKRIRYFLNYMRRSLESGTITPYYTGAGDDCEAGFCFVPFLWCGFFIWLAERGGMG